MVKAKRQRDEIWRGLRHVLHVAPPAKRCKCQRCGEPLQMWTAEVPVEGDLLEYAEKGASESDAAKRFLRAIGWLRIERNVFDHRPMLVFWDGKYSGYGSYLGRPLFCSTGCAIGYATVSYKAGMRMIQDGVKITRKDDDA